MLGKLGEGFGVDLQLCGGDILSAPQLFAFFCAASAPDMKPIFGLECQIFSTPAVTVTASSQSRGIRVTSANAGERRGAPVSDPPGCLGEARAGSETGAPRVIFKMMVVARQSAMAARSWLAMPKMGQSALMPPSGSRTAAIRK